RGPHTSRRGSPGTWQATRPRGPGNRRSGPPRRRTRIDHPQLASRALRPASNRKGSRYTLILMTRRLLLLFAVLAASMFGENRVFELRTYVTNEGKFETLLTRFRDHTIRIFARHGMESIGYWIPQDPEKSKNTLIYIIAHKSREQAT